MRHYKEKAVINIFILCILGISYLETIDPGLLYFSDIRQSQERPGLMKDIWWNIQWVFNEMVPVWWKQDYTSHDDLSKEK